ncbi:MAG: IS3 family transposase [Veillonellales bacterium]
MQVDWLKKNLKNCSDLTTRVNIVRNLLKTKKLPVETGAKLLSVNRTSVYYHTPPVSEEELDCKAIIDHLHTDNPAWGARQMSSQLKTCGYHVDRRKVRRYMMEMGIDAIYPKMNLSKRQQKAKVFPYLLKSAAINRPNQAWSIDITYIPIKHGFLYLTAVIDWYSRCIVGWEIDDTLDTRMVITALKKAFKVAKPLILNSDQGSQFTSNDYIDFVKQNHIRQSMDGKSRWADNIMIERWFRTFKYEEAYLTQYNNIKEARKAVKEYIKTYNFQRCHSAIGNIPPAKVYFPAMLLDDAEAAA